MQYEIEKHWDKLKRLSKISDSALNEVRFKVYSKINFINEELIPEKIWLTSEKLVSDIDTDDIDFVALTKYIKGYLWTGDKHLYKGLKQKNFTRVFNTPEILLRRNK
jgi:predicted nucleic acid-binding protein